MQKLVYASTQERDVRPADLAQLVRAWDILEDRKRILRGRPLPGSLKPKARKSQRTFNPSIPSDIQAMPEPLQTLDGMQAGTDGKESLSGREP